MTEKIPMGDISTKLPACIDLFIGAVSFEIRCASIASQIAQITTMAKLVRNREYLESSAKAHQEMLKLFGTTATEVIITTESPTETADTFVREIISAIPDDAMDNVLVDITSFTHEQLLILFGLIYEKKPKCKVYFGYTGAEKYSTNTDESNVWLSRGVRQVRSVLGYPGGIAPSKRLHLMVLVGFEHERAHALIEIMEPAKLSLGVGAQGASVSEVHFNRNERFHKTLYNYLESRKLIDTEIETFTFSCVDPDETCSAVLSQANKFPEYNAVLCPMNTKLSTVGAGLAALKEERIQIVYTLPAEYNVEGYSTPGPTATIFELSY